MKECTFYMIKDTEVKMEDSIFYQFDIYIIRQISYKYKYSVFILSVINEVKAEENLIQTQNNQKEIIVQNNYL